jgi:hypothetical protein
MKPPDKTSIKLCDGCKDRESPIYEVDPKNWAR